MPIRKFLRINGTLNKLKLLTKVKPLRLQFLTCRLSTKVNFTTVWLSKLDMNITQRTFMLIKKLSNLNGMLKKLKMLMRANLSRLQFLTCRLSTKESFTTAWLSKLVMNTTQITSTLTKKLSSLNGMLKKLKMLMRANLSRLQLLTCKLSTKPSSTTVWLFNSMASTLKSMNNQLKSKRTHGLKKMLRRKPL
jgi:hypothetical protein